MKLLSHVQLFVTPWTVAYQAPPSMVFSRQEYWSGLPFPFSGDLPDRGIEPGSPALEVDAFTMSHQGSPLSSGFQSIARRDKQAFLSEQCKEIEENNRMWKTRDVFRKIRDTKGTFHAKMGTIKDINVKDLIEAEEIKKRWQEYTGELYQKKS